MRAGSETQFGTFACQKEHATRTQMYACVQIPGVSRTVRPYAKSRLCPPHAVLSHAHNLWTQPSKRAQIVLAEAACGFNATT